LSDEEIKKMKQEAEANAESDKKMKEEIEKLNTADSLIFSTEKQMKEYGDKIPADKKTAIEEALTELKEAHKEKNMSTIDNATQKLNTAWQAASEEMYKAASEAQANPGAEGQPSQDGGPEAGGPKAEGDVTDVDFEEVKEGEKK
jgi:molecular chaperone DnaK